jgi:prolycopene isomerase
MARYPKKFDIIVIGAGLAGLSCAAYLLKAGCRVLLLEKNLRAGGYATSYTVQKHRFDIAVQAIGGCDEQGVVYRLLADLHLENRIRFLRCEPARAYFFDRHSGPWLQPGSIADMVASIYLEFPEYKDSVEKCYRTWAGIMTELNEIAQTGKSAVFGFSKSYPLLSAYGDCTLQTFLDDWGFPADLQRLISARHGYCMLPPEELSLVGFACTEMSYGGGAWMVEGGMARLSGTIADFIVSNGGYIRNRSKVIGIDTGTGSNFTVRVESGAGFSSSRVVLASSVLKALQKWPGICAGLPARYASRLRSMEKTGSYFITYYSVPESAVAGMWPNMEIRLPALDNRIDPPADVLYALVPSMVDKTASPQGYHCLCLSVPCLSGRKMGRRQRRRYRQFMEEAVVARFPELKNELSYLFMLGPEHLAAISGNPDGSAYGWKQTPAQSGVKRLPLKTPVPGLFLAGHWSMPGGGIPGVVTSGRLCAQAILDSL